MNAFISMMALTQYDQYKSKFRIALIVFFTVLTFSFGYVRHEMGDEIRNFGQLLIIGTVITIGLALWLKVRIKLNFKYSGIMYVLLAWLFFIHFFRSDMSGSTKNMLNIFFTQVLVIVVSNIFWKIPFNKLMNIFLIYLHVMMLISVYVHILYVGPIELGNHDVDVRFGGLFFFGITGVLAGFGAIISTFQYFGTEEKKLRFRYMASTAVFAFYILAADMRTVMAAITVSIFIQYLFKRKSQNKSIWPLVVMGGALYGIVQVYKSYSEGGDVERDLSIREVIWGVGQKMIADQPLIGYGTYTDDINRLSIADTKYSDLFNELKLPDPHSSFLSLMIQSGLVSFAIYLFLLVKIVQLSRRYSVYNRALLSLIAFWLVCGSTGGNYFDFTYSIQGMAFELSIFAIMLHPELWQPQETEQELSQEDNINNQNSATTV